MTSKTLYGKLPIEQHESHKISGCYERVSSSCSYRDTRRVTDKTTRASCDMDIALVTHIYVNKYILQNKI